VLGRLLADSCARYASECFIRFDVLSLRGVRPVEGAASVRGFRGRQVALAAAVWRLQARAPRPALVFDVIGLARTQTFVPSRWASPYILFLLGVEVWQPVRWSALKAVQKAAVRLAISQTTRQLSHPHLHLPPNAIDVIHLALEDRQLDGAKDPVLLDRAGSDFLLIVGRLDSRERYKGHDLLIEALPRVHQTHPAARIVIAGVGDDQDRLAAKARSLGLADRVILTGFVSEATLAELYRRCSVFVMPSRGEGFGLVYLEAMRAGRPCIGAKETVGEEVIADGETGVLVDAEDPNELGSVISDLLSNPARAAAMGSAGRARLGSRFSLGQFRSALAGHLDRVTA
jgi:glycosyltransferase involved in cell wall biosynthesis